MDIPASAKRIALDELPRWSPWPWKLLDADSTNVPARTIEKIDSEYDKDKYASCIDFYRRHPDATVETVKKQCEMKVLQTETRVSIGDDLYVIPQIEALTLNDMFFLESAGPSVEQADTIVELGCGYGYNLWLLSKHFPGKTYLGGEYSQNAVALANELYSNGSSSIRVEQFNFYDASYHILEHLRRGGRTLVFTRHAVEQLPSAASVLAGLSRYKKAMHEVLNLEPLYEENKDSLLSLLRRRYIEVNDYNRDLLALLRSDKNIVVHDVRFNVFGLNPLNATSVIRWSFSGF